MSSNENHGFNNIGKRLDGLPHIEDIKPKPIIEESKKTEIPQENVSEPSSTQTASSEPVYKPSDGKGSVPVGKITLGIIGLFIVISIFNSGSNQNSTPTSTSQTATQTTPAPQSQPVPQNTSIGPIEEVPPYGTSISLSRNQIRYCLSEKIRIDALRYLVDNSSQSELDKFNAAVDDYNNRCGHFRYKRGSLESVRSEVESNRSALKNEAQSKLNQWRNIATSTPAGAYTTPAQPISPVTEQSQAPVIDKRKAKNINAEPRVYEAKPLRPDKYATSLSLENLEFCEIKRKTGLELKDLCLVNNTPQIYDRFKADFDLQCREKQFNESDYKLAKKLVSGKYNYKKLAQTIYDKEL